MNLQLPGAALSRPTICLQLQSLRYGDLKMCASGLGIQSIKSGAIWIYLQLQSLEHGDLYIRICW